MKGNDDMSINTAWTKTEIYEGDVLICTYGVGNEPLDVGICEPGKTYRIINYNSLGEVLNVITVKIPVTITEIDVRSKQIDVRYSYIPGYGIGYERINTGLGDSEACDTSGEVTFPDLAADEAYEVYLKDADGEPVETVGFTTLKAVPSVRVKSISENSITWEVENAAGSTVKVYPTNQLFLAQVDEADIVSDYQEVVSTGLTIGVSYTLVVDDVEAFSAEATTNNLFYENPGTVFEKTLHNVDRDTVMLLEDVYSGQEGPQYRVPSDFVNLYDFHMPITSYTLADEGRNDVLNNNIRPSRSFYGWRVPKSIDSTGKRIYRNLRWHNGVDLSAEKHTHIYAIDDALTIEHELNADGVIYSVATVFLDQTKYDCEELETRESFDYSIGGSIITFGVGTRYSEVKEYNDSELTQIWAKKLLLTFEDIKGKVNEEGYVKKYAYADYLHLDGAVRPDDGTVFLRGSSIRNETHQSGITSDTGSPGSYHLHFELHLPNAVNALQYFPIPGEEPVNKRNMLLEKFGSVNPSRYFSVF